MIAYLDNSATTRCFDDVVKVMTGTMLEEFGNPSSMHLKGVEAEKHIIDAKKNISKILKVNEKEIFFTSGGTESNNLAIMGTAYANIRSGKHIITTAVEHASVSNVMKNLEENGFDITYLPVNEYGEIQIDDLKKALREDTILVSVMYVNNEIGAVQPVEEIAKEVKEFNKKIIVHVDAIQAFGKYKILPGRNNIDLLSVSGHKIHGPKGVGFLYVNNKIKIKPIIFGGDQQSGLRSGTENIPGIAGISKASVISYQDFEQKRKYLYELKKYFIESLQEIEDVRCNSSIDEKGAPHIVNASFKGVRSEVLLHSLEEAGVYVSAGSACASNKPSVSSTLKSIGLPESEIDCALRFSFSVETTKEELEYCIEQLKVKVPVLRKYARH